MINKPFKQAQRDLNIIKSLSMIGLEEAARSDEEEESLLSISEIFPGFLAIGTLGSSDPPTPKFSISIDHMITERETEKVTPNELKLINDELEKVLDAEAKHDGGRNSHGSTMSTLGSKVWDNMGSSILEGSKNNNNDMSMAKTVVVCPLQGYLFGSLVELSETTTVVKKENRTSLGELFQRSKLVAEEGCEKDDDEKQVEIKEGDHKYGMQLIKKKLKKRILNAAFKTSSNSTAAGGHLDASSETKLHKVICIKFFHFFGIGFHDIKEKGKVAQITA